MRRLMLLAALAGIALALNLVPTVSAQEGPVTEPGAESGPPADVYGQPLYGTRDNPWTGVMQTWLRGAGFRPGPTDLWFGNQTDAAVRRFQTAVGLDPTGEWTWETSQAQQSYTPPPTSEPVSTSYGVWDRLAECESNGNWSIATGNGYYGGLQFALGSWRAAGGSGYPHHHSREEQIRVAENLLAMQGWSAWPACSRQLGLR